METPGRWPSKGPTDKVKLGMDWTGHLAPGDTILTSTWSVAPIGLLLGTTAVSGNKATVSVDGGTSKETYLLSCRITTQQGEDLTRSGSLTVTPR